MLVFIYLFKRWAGRTKVAFEGKSFKSERCQVLTSNTNSIIHMKYYVFNIIIKCIKSIKLFRSFFFNYIILKVYSL